MTSCNITAMMNLSPNPLIHSLLATLCTNN